MRQPHHREASVSSEATSQIARSRAPRKGTGHPYRLILVDDHADIRLLLATRLSMIPGWQIVGEAGNGSEAIGLARERRPDAVILDLEMPVMSGRQVIPILRAAVPGIRILVYSAHAEPDKEFQGAVKPDAVVAKGTDLSVLIQQLQRLLAESPADVLKIDLGRIPLSQAISAFDSWVGLNFRIREAAIDDDDLSVQQKGGARLDELLALSGVFLQLANPLLHASQAGQTDVDLRLEIRRDAAQAARRGLVHIESGGFEEFLQAWNYNGRTEARGALNALRDRLIQVLPAS
jgi:CheY-like chemotaxis protein